MHTVYLGIGSNIGNREDNCLKAISLLERNGLKITKRSTMHETEPWGVEDQPRFINMAVEAETDLLPRELLGIVKKIESDMGRLPGEKWGPRLIDIDILMYENLTMTENDLTLPHPLMHEREFVLKPLSELAGDMVHPLLGKTIHELLTRLIEKVMGEDGAVLVPEVLDRFVGYYTEHIVDFTVPYPDVRETLARLGSYRKAVISNKREALSKKLLEDLGLAAFFDLILGSDSVEEKKPSPKPLIKVLETFSLAPDEAVIVGDSNFDIEAGGGAGVRSIAVSYGYRDVGSLKAADFIIDDISELVAILDRLQ